VELFFQFANSPGQLEPAENNADRDASHCDYDAPEQEPENHQHSPAPGTEMVELAFF